MNAQCDTATQSPWQDSSLSPDERARLLVAELTLEEKVALLHSHFAVQPAGSRPEGALGSAAAEVAAVVAAWYPGGRGAEALAAVLTGRVNPSGRLPVSFPAGTAELPRPQLRDPATTQNHPGQPRFGAFSVDYDIEGSDVGYRWYAKTATHPAYPFGHGLSYTTFGYSDLTVTVPGDDVTVAFDVTNIGTVIGADVPQVYVELPGGTAPRLAAWQRLTLEPGERRRVTLVLEPRILANYDTSLPGWRKPAGTYRISLRRNAEAVVLQADVELAERRRQP